MTVAAVFYDSGGSDRGSSSNGGGGSDSSCGTEGGVSLAAVARTAVVATWTTTRASVDSMKPNAKVQAE